MPLYAFHSETKPHIVGVTTDEAGANLPAEYGSWFPVGRATPSNAPDNVSAKIAQDVERQGFAIIQAYDIAGLLPRGEA